MNNRLLIFIGAMIATGIFVYLIASFLVATFDITLWYDYYRFFAVVAYLLLLGGFIEALGSSDKDEKKEKVIKKEDEVGELVR